MVFPTDESKCENAMLRNSFILQKLRQARAEDETEKNEASSQDISHTPKKHVHKKHVKSEMVRSLSSSSGIDKIQLIKRSTIQEQLFAEQCQRSRQNFKKYSTSTESENSTNTKKRISRPQAKNNSRHKLQQCNYNNNDNTRSNDNDKKVNNDNESDNECSKIDVLHWNKPFQVTNSDDEKYFTGSSSTKHIDWSSVNGKKNEDKKTAYDETDKNAHSLKEIEDFSGLIPIDETDFFNFVSNSTTSETVYRASHKLKETIKSASESPILQLQNAINHYKVDAVMVKQEIKEAFKPSQEGPKIIDSIDSHNVDIESATLQNKQSRYNVKRDVHFARQKKQKRSVKESRRQKLDEIEPESKTISNNGSSTVERKKMIEENSDDVNDFVKPNSTTILSSIGHENSEKRFGTDEHLDTVDINRKLIEKFKNSRSSSSSSSLDSDDTSSEKSNEVNRLSTTRGSTTSKFATLKNRLAGASTQISLKPAPKFETLKSRLLSASTQTSLQKKSNHKININLNLEGVEEPKINEHKEEPLIKEFDAPRLNKLVVDKTVTEIEKDSPKEEPLLKPVFSRYFSTLKEKNANENSASELENESNTIQVVENDLITHEINISNKTSTANDVNGEIKEAASDCKQICEDNSLTSSSEESILNMSDNKIDNNQLTVSINTSNEEKKDSEEEATLNNQSEQDELSLTDCKEEMNYADFEGINADEEFDLVNYEQFSTFSNLFNALQAVTAAQKEHDLGIQNELNCSDLNIDENDTLIQLKGIDSRLDNLKNNHSSMDENELNNSNISVDESDTLIQLKGTDTILDNLNNNNSSMDVSISSNLKSDNENSVNSSSLTNKNVIENTQSNTEDVSNDHFNENETSNAAKLKSETHGINQKTEISARQKKKFNALKNYRNRKVVEEEHQPTQKNEITVQNECLKPKESTGKLLQEIMKLKLHLNCKTWV